MTTDTVIETHGLTRRFGATEAVTGLELEVSSGGVFALLGRNGAGKTTTLKLLSGLLRPTAGESKVLGRPSLALSAADWQRIGYVSEGQELYAWMTIDESLAFTRPLYPDWDLQLERSLRRHARPGLRPQGGALLPGRTRQAGAASGPAFPTPAAPPRRAAERPGSVEPGGTALRAARHNGAGAVVRVLLDPGGRRGRALR